MARSQCGMTVGRTAPQTVYHVTGKEEKNKQANCCEVNLQNILTPTMSHGCCHVTKQPYWGYGFWVLLSLRSVRELQKGM